MQCTTKREAVQLIQVRLHALVVFSILVLVLLGRMPISQAGWITCPPQVVRVAPQSWRPRQGGPWRLGHVRHRVACWRYLRHTWYTPVVRSLLLGLLWHLSGQPGPAWVRLVPWGLWQGAGLVWPWLRCQPEWQGRGWLLGQAQRWLMVGYLGMAVGTLWPSRWPTWPFPAPDPLSGPTSPWVLGLGGVVCAQEEPLVEVIQVEDGGWRATLCGHFTLQVAGDHPFRKRLLLLFLRLLEVPGQQRGSRRTRDGRTPFVRQQDLAQALGMPQPDLSRIEGHWLAGDWANLLSLQTAEVLTRELMGRIVEVFVTFPWWGVEKVYGYLREQEVAVSERQVRQAAEQSGWNQLRQTLLKRYHLTAESIRPRDHWLMAQLLAPNETLLSKLEAGQGLTPPEEQVAVADLRALVAEAGMVVQPPLKALPWMMRVERVVFGHWEAVTDGTVRCIYCGSTQVVRKSKKPRWKKYYDAEGKLQTVEVDRYYCRNQACHKGSFTNLPPGLVPYSPYRTKVHLLGLQRYAWGGAAPIGARDRRWGWPA